MTAPFIFALLGIAVATGTLTGFTGASGMSILISGLLLAGVDIREIIALTFVVTFANGISSSIPYGRKGLIDWRLALSIGLSASVSVYPGFLASESVSDSLLKWIILTGLLLAGLKLLAKPGVAQSETESEVKHSLWKEILAGIVFGLVIGMLGGGGGVFIAVVLLVLFKTSAKSAIGTSIVIMTLAAVPGCFLHGWDNNINWAIAGIVIPVSISIAFLAARAGRKIPEAWVKRGLGVYLVSIFFIMLARELF